MQITSIKPRVSTLDLRIGSPAAVERIRGHKLMVIRERILVRDGCVCVRCGIGVGDLVVDHIVPLYLGGSESDENRQTLCKPCHDKKSEQEEKDRLIGG